MDLDKDIELIDLLRILFKRRYHILLITLLFVAVTGVVCMNMEKIFKVSMVLNTGFAGIDNSSKELDITSIDDLKAIINSKVYEQKIIDELYPKKDESKPEGLHISESMLSGSNFIKVSCEINNKSLGEKVLNRLHALLEAHYAIKVDTCIKKYVQDIEAVKNEFNKNESEMVTLNNNILQEKVKYKTEIAEIEHSILAAQQQKKSINDKINNAVMKIETVENEIVNTRANTKSLIETRDSFLKNSVVESNVLSSFVFSSTVQQAIGYLNVLINSSSNYYNRMSDEKEKLAEKEKFIKDQSSQKKNLSESLIITIDNLKLNIQDLKNKQTDLLSQINFIESQKNSVSNILMIEPPMISKYPIKPKAGVAIAVAGLSGLFTSFFLAFFLEYLDVCRYREKDTTVTESFVRSM